MTVGVVERLTRFLVESSHAVIGKEHGSNSGEWQILQSLCMERPHGTVDAGQGSVVGHWNARCEAKSARVVMTLAALLHRL